MANLDIYFSGEKLIGNDYSSDEIENWYEDEREAYANLGSKDKQYYQYGYHQLNKMHGFNRIKLNGGTSTLAFGAAYGDELLPIADKLGDVVVLDPSDAFVVENSPIKSVRWQKPDSSGKLDFDDNSFELVTCLGVLHHVPNVGFVLSEIYRVLKNGGVLILREPIVSMGDWTTLRVGLTKRERGIPQKLLIDMCEDVGFTIKSKRLCMFGALPKLLIKVGISISIYNNKTLTLLDFILSKVFAFNVNTYHRTSVIQKIAPSNLYLVLKK